MVWGNSHQLTLDSCCLSSGVAPVLPQFELHPHACKTSCEIMAMATPQLLVPRILPHEFLEHLQRNWSLYRGEERTLELPHTAYQESMTLHSSRKALGTFFQAPALLNAITHVRATAHLDVAIVGCGANDVLVLSIINTLGCRRDSVGYRPIPKSSFLGGAARQAANLTSSIW